MGARDVRLQRRDRAAARAPGDAALPAVHAHRAAARRPGASPQLPLWVSPVKRQGFLSTMCRL